MAYPEKIVFALIYQKGKNCESIEKRINSDLPYLRAPIDAYSNKLSHLMVLDCVDKKTLIRLKKTSNITLRNKILKEKIDEFFESKGNKIISRVVEIMLQVRV